MEEASTLKKQMLGMLLVTAARDFKRGDNAAKVKNLLDQGAPVDAVDHGSGSARTALGHAVANNCEDLVSLLAASGADVDGRDGETGLPYLALAMSKIAMDAMRGLIAAGADVNVQGPVRKTLLLEAVSWQRHDFVEIFLNAGAKIDGAAELIADMKKNTDITMTIFGKVEQLIANKMAEEAAVRAQQDAFNAWAEQGLPTQQSVAVPKKIRIRIP